MLPLQLALVPYEENLVSPNELLRVAAALQVQVTRDFTPLWGIPATISAFITMKDVPPATIPLVIVPPRLMQTRDHGFHLTRRHQPIGLVTYTDGWSWAASHEMLEILVDPYGRAKVLGRSLSDDHVNAVVPEWRKSAQQGQVEYLLEICDPVQDNHYTVCGCQVSDFALASFYTPKETTGVRYSFMGDVRGPRELLRGGYLTWYTCLKDAPVWQAVRDRRSGDLTIGPMSAAASAFTREWVDQISDLFGAQETPVPPPPQADAVANIAQDSAECYGRLLRDDVESVLNAIYQGSGSPEVTLKALLRELELLATNQPLDGAGKGPYDKFSQDSAERLDVLRRLGIDQDIYGGGKVPSRRQFITIRDSLKRIAANVDPAHVGLSKLLAAVGMQGST